MALLETSSGSDRLSEVGLLHAADPKVPGPFSMAPTAPVHVPAVISLAFWGGVWGTALWVLVKNMRGASTGSVPD